MIWNKYEKYIEVKTEITNAKIEAYGFYFLFLRRDFMLNSPSYGAIFLKFRITCIMLILDKLKIFVSIRLTQPYQAIL